MTMEPQKSCSSDTPPETAVSLAEAARRVGVSRRTLQRALQAGTLRKQPDGRIALADLLALGYELGPGGKSSVLAVRLLEELTTAHARERELWQQHVAALQAHAEATQHQQAALQAQVAALQKQHAAFVASVQLEPLPPSEAVPPGPPGRCRLRALAGLGLLLLLL